jgi:hypothetical protein
MSVLAVIPAAVASTVVLPGVLAMMSPEVSAIAIVVSATRSVGLADWMTKPCASTT